MHHLDHVGQRRRVAYRCGQQYLFGRAVQPRLHQLFRTRSQRLAAHGARAQYLHEVAQHLAIVDHAGEGRRQLLRTLPRQHGQQQGRHVFHMATLAAIDGRLRDKLSIDGLAQVQHHGQLRFGAGVERRVQAAGGRILRQLVARRQRIRWRAFGIDGQRRRQQAGLFCALE